MKQLKEKTTVISHVLFLNNNDVADISYEPKINGQVLGEPGIDRCDIFGFYPDHSIS